MKPAPTNLIPFPKERPDWNPANHRSAERRADDMARGNEVEREAAIFLMQHDYSVQKITRFDFDIPEYPAGFYNYENDEVGEGWESFVAFDLLVCGRTSFLAEVKHKTIHGHGSGQHYLLDCHRLRRMGKAYRNASDLQHLFVVYDSRRTEAPACGFFAVTMDQLLENKSSYRTQRSFGDPAYKIPTKEFRPLTYFLKQYNTTKDYAHGIPEQPLPRIDEAA